ncbi:MAG: A/G-specific adenine glycosylase [Oscillospiraceae bacterium]|nr:A/G-specific adenine glycosylase [Oscillospiraceae bacterium]
MTQLEQLPIPLLQWYAETARDLPWRAEPTPYHVLVSELMLQQTRVAAVLEYYRRFMEELPTVEALAAVEDDRLMKLWQGLGYYNRARNLKKAACRIVEEYGGVFPSQYEDLLSLPGVGEYTAGAIASIAFGVPVPAVDGNVLRVVARLTGDDADISGTETKKRMRAGLQAVMPTAAPGDFNQALMDLGALVCLPNGLPLCGQCPAAEFCAAKLQNRTADLPVKAAKKARRVEERTVFFIFHHGCVALRRRPARGLLAGLWEYPNECAPAPFPVTPLVAEPGGTAKHIFTHVEWHMTAQVLRAADAALPEGWVWADRAALRHVYAVPNAFQRFLPLVERYLGA